MPHPTLAPATTPLGPLAQLAGADLEVQTTTGPARYVNLDSAATAPALAAVVDAVTSALSTYGSVHRGAGHTAVASTNRYAAARRSVARFVHARADDHVVFTRNTTDAINLLAGCLPAGTTVLGFAAEHHANLLPWRRHAYVSLGFPISPEDAVDRVREALARRRGPALVAVTGASNVTGELWPVPEIVDVAHEHGARVLVDAAQLVAHRAVDLSATGIDYLAFSGHKLYAPFGAGALVGRADWLDAAPPHLPGGGAAEQVAVDDVRWVTGPARHEGGTPNLVGAVALAAACDEVRRIGFAEVAEHESALAGLLADGLADIGGVHVLALWEGAPRVGVASFVVGGRSPEQVATQLAAHGIGVRHGSFCAHPLVEHLTGRRSGNGRGAGGAVRVSLGLGSSTEDVERFLHALRLVSSPAAA
jgi:selenocysteine lyase/cysteine desulfurase